MSFPNYGDEEEVYTPNLSHIHESLRQFAVRADSLVFDPVNARVHDEKNLGAIEASLRSFGQRIPLIANSKTRVVSVGNGRLRVIRDRLGWEYLSCVFSDDTPELARAFALADNRTSELAQWNPEQLAIDLELLSKFDNELLVGWDNEDLKLIFPSIGDEVGGTTNTKNPETLHGDERVAAAGIDISFVEAALRGVFSSIKSVEEFARLFVDPMEEAFQYINLLHGNSDSCMRTSLLFNPHRLDVCTITSKVSPYAFIRRGTKLDSMARSVLFHSSGNKRIPPTTLYNVFTMGFCGVQIAGEFRPSIARDIYTRYGIKKHSRILDPCAGWGGRMIGASTVSNHYHAFEPSTKTHRGLLSCEKFIKQFRPDFCAVVECLPFEESKLKGGSYDIALTSPPYFNTEKYAEEKTNSHIKFPDFDSWISGFFEPLVKKTMSALKPDAPFILNIGSRKYPIAKTLHRLCLKNRFKLKKLGNFLASGDGLGRSKGKDVEGEMFYEIKK